MLLRHVIEEIFVVSWIIHLYENSNECLTRYCREINKSGPAKFRTKADNPEEQRCYHNISFNDKLSERFWIMTQRNKDSETDEHNFKIEKATGKTKSSE